MDALTSAIIQAITSAVEPVLRQIVKEELHDLVTNPLLVSPEEAAKRLSIGSTMVRKLMDRGELDTVQIGRARRVYYPSLRAYVERRLHHGR